MLLAIGASVTVTFEASVENPTGLWPAKGRRGLSSALSSTQARCLAPLDADEAPSDSWCAWRARCTGGGKVSAAHSYERAAEVTTPRA